MVGLLSIKLNLESHSVLGQWSLCESAPKQPNTRYAVGNPRRYEDAGGREASAWAPQSGCKVPLLASFGLGRESARKCHQRESVPHRSSL